MEIDLVYPCHAKDKITLDLCIKYARKNIKNYVIYMLYQKLN